MYDHLQESCAMSRLTSNVEENITPPVTNQQRTEECSFGPWMMVKTAAAIPRAKLRNKGKSSATPKLTTLISRRKPQVVTLSEFLILTRNLSKASSLNPPSLDQSKHSAVVVDENLNPNILVIPSSLPTLPTTSLVPPASEPPDKQLQPTSGEVPHAPVGASLQFNQTDVISDALGCGNWRFLLAARQVLRDYKPDLVVFVEPRISGRKADSVIASLGFPNLHRVEAAGFSVDVIANHFQFIHYCITNKLTRHSVYATAVYASPSSSGQRGVFKLQASLDRFICNNYWDEVYPTSVVSHLFRLRSDHRPILLQVGHSRTQPLAHQFKYFLGWLSHEDFNRMILDNWCPKATMTETLLHFSKAVDVCNKLVFGYIGRKKRMIMALGFRVFSLDLNQNC
ncbi:hypothetical protein V6N13_053267 [Hibiscus sabdariffa]